MKHSLISPHGGVPALFDLLAAGLGARPAADRSRSAPQTVTPPRRSWLDRMEHALWRARQRDLERYLETSVDAVDLEDRLHRLERRMFHRYY